MVMKQVLFAFYPLFVSWNNGIALLSAICKGHDIGTDLILLDTMDGFLEKIKSNNYDHICFSCVTLQDYEMSLPFMLAAAEIGYSVLLGGVYASKVKPKLSFARVCTGDGELLPMFINYGIEGVLNSYICSDIENLPLPDYDLFSGIPYNRELMWLPETTKYTPYSSSRGCPFSCPFCAIHYQKPKNQRIRYKVEDDLKYLISKYQPDVIALGDSLPPYWNKKWRESWGDVRHPFVTYIRADAKESELQWLHDRGMIGCFFGVEAGNEAYRNQVLGKHLYNKDILRTVGLLNEMGIHFMASYMQNTPNETWELQGETVSFAREIGGYSVFNIYKDIMMI